MRQPENEMTKLGFGLIASSLLFASTGLAQNVDHAKHHLSQAREQKAAAKQGMDCCCMQSGMKGMKGMAGMPPMAGMKMPAMDGMSGMMPPPQQGMMAGQMDPKMMADMQAADQKLQDLVKAMNDAPDSGKLDAATAVINEMAAQHAAMKKMMMEHMAQMNRMGGMAPKPAAHHKN